MRFKRILSFIFPVLLALIVSAGPAITAFAAPALPQYFRGTVTYNGSPAAIGTIIEARGTGVIQGDFNPITITETGTYGSTDPLANVPRLLVQGDESLVDGATISFYINGVLADQTAEFASGQITDLNLTATATNDFSTESATETSIAEAIGTGNLAVIKVNIDRITLIATGEALPLPGGLGAFTGQLTISDPNVEIIQINGTAQTGPISYDPGTGIFSVASLVSPMQPNNTTVAEIVVGISGDSALDHTIQVQITSITAAGDPGTPYSPGTLHQLSFKRGDANNDGTIGIGDALYIAQYIVGQRTAAGIRLINGASANHVTGVGDQIGIGDALYIAQYIVGQRNSSFQ